MLNRLSAICLLAAVVLGYALAGVPVRAEDPQRRFPGGINRGDKVTLQFEYGSMGTGGFSLSCTIAETYESWVRCAPSDEFTGSRDQRWYDLSRVVVVTKTER